MWVRYRHDLAMVRAGIAAVGELAMQSFGCFIACQVAMQQWLDRNFGSVTAMYEDRHELWGFDHRGRLFRRTLPARRAKVRAHIPRFFL